MLIFAINIGFYNIGINFCIVLSGFLSDVTTNIAAQVAFNAFLNGKWGAEELYELDGFGLRKGGPIRLWVRVTDEAFEVIMAGDASPVCRRADP